MRSLFIDTSTSILTIAIIEDNKILYNHIEKVEKDMSNKIIPIIEEAFGQSGIEINDINKIFVINGPGSFTGVRIGVTVAKIISWSLKIDVIPISSLEYIATTETEKKYIVPMIDARRGNVFAGIYDTDLNNILPDQLIKFDELIKLLPDDYDLVSYDINNCIMPKCNILKIINKHLIDQSVNAHQLNPKYLKLTEAEEKLNDKRSN